MSKIKKFRVTPRLSSVLKGLKALTGSTQTTPELEKAVESEVRRAGELYATAALYDTFEPGQTPDWAAALWDPPAGPEGAQAKPVALTFFAATVGAPLEDELGGALSRGEGLLSQILTAVGEESADQAASFVQRLVSEEALRESCELSPHPEALPPGLKREVLSLLAADKVHIRMDGQGHLSPRFTRVGTLLWRSPKKRK